MFNHYYEWYRDGVSTHSKQLIEIFNNKVDIFKCDIEFYKQSQIEYLNSIIDFSKKKRLSEKQMWSFIKSVDYIYFYNRPKNQRIFSYKKIPIIRQ